MVISSCDMRKIVRHASLSLSIRRASVASWDCDIDDEATEMVERMVWQWGLDYGQGL